MKQTYRFQWAGLQRSAKKLGMLINSEKTEVQHLGKGKKDIQIRIDGKALTQTERFVCV